MGVEFSVLEFRQMTSENNGTFAGKGRLNSMTRGLNCRPTLRLVRLRGTRRFAWSRPRLRSRVRRLRIDFQPAHSWDKAVRVFLLHKAV